MQGVRFRSSKTQTRLTSCQIPDDLIQSLQNCGLGAVAEVGPLQQLIDEAGADMKADSGPQLSNTLALKKTLSSFLVKDAGSELNQIQAESDRGEPQQEAEVLCVDGC